MIYLDNNATTFIDPVVAEAMYQLQLQGFANPASQHQLGRMALRKLEESKESLLTSLAAPNTGMDSAQVILTSGGTEANNLAIRGYCSQSSGLIIVAATEHASVLDVAKSFGPERCRVLPVDKLGRIDLHVLEDWLRRDATRVDLVSVMLGNNETGVIQDLQAVCELCRPFGVPVHSDAVQAVGKIPVAMRELGLSALTMTAHKLHGPVGIGALVLLQGQKIVPILLGGGQQLGLRPGTEPVIPAAGLSLAVQLATQKVSEGQFATVKHLQDEFESLLSELGEIEIVAQQAQRLPHVSTVAFHGVDRQGLQMALDFAGVACSTGSACASGSSRPSPVLSAMQLSSQTVSSAIRFSFSRFSTEEDALTAAQIICETVRKLRAK